MYILAIINHLTASTMEVTQKGQITPQDAGQSQDECLGGTADSTIYPNAKINNK